MDFPQTTKEIAALADCPALTLSGLLNVIDGLLNDSTMVSGNLDNIPVGDPQRFVSVMSNMIEIANKCLPEAKKNALSRITQSMIGTIEVSLDGISAKIKTTNEETAAMMKECDELKEANQKKEKANAALQEQVEAKKTKDKLYNELTAAFAEGGDITPELVSLLNGISEKLGTETNKYLYDIKKAYEKLETFRKTHKDKKTESDNLNGEINTLNGEIDVLNKSIEEKESEKEGLEKKKTEKETALKTLQEEIEAAKKVIEQKNELIQRASQDKVNAENELNEKNKELDEANSAAEAAKTEISGLQEQINKLNRDLEKFKTSSQRYQNDVDDLERQIEPFRRELNKALRELAGDAKYLMECISVLNIKPYYADSLEPVSRCADRISEDNYMPPINFRDSITGMSDVIENLKAALQAFQSEYTDLSRKIMQLHNLEKIKNQADRLRESCKGKNIDANIDKLQRETEAYSGIITGIVEDQKKLSGCDEETGNRFHSVIENAESCLGELEKLGAGLKGIKNKYKNLISFMSGGY